MKNKFVNYVLLFLFTANINAQTIYLDSGDNDKTSIKEENSITIEKPKKRSWKDLKTIMSNDLLSSNELKIRECSESDNNLGVKSSYYQNILYNDYQWNEYMDKNSNRCIQMVYPTQGFLSEFESRILLSASQGHKFHELGFWEESREYALKTGEYLPECEGVPSIDYENIHFDKSVDADTFVVNDNNNYDYEDSVTSSIPNIEIPVKNDSYSNNDILTTSSACVYKNNSKNNDNKLSIKNNYIGIMGNDDRVPVTDGYLLGTDYNFMAQIKNAQQTPFSSGDPTSLNCKKDGSGFFINPHSVVTVAHNLYFLGCNVTNWRISAYDAPNHKVIYTSKQGFITPSWLNVNGEGMEPFLSNTIHDFGLLKTTKAHNIPYFPIINIGRLFPLQETLNDAGTAYGYPTIVGNPPSSVSNILFTESRSVYNNYTVIDAYDSNSRGLISHFFDQTAGQSGGPLSFTQHPSGNSTIAGVISGYINNFNYATALDNYSSPIILTWANSPGYNIDINIRQPSYLETYIWSSITNNSFSADASNNSRYIKSKDIESNLIWSSDKNGVFGSGLSVTANEAKSVLRTGYHEIKLSIDTPDYTGQDIKQIYIQGPEGSFLIPSNRCIINLASNPNSCIIPVSWSTTNSPDTIVYNNRTNTVFATASSGNNVPFTATHSQDTELVLYASTDKIYDIDRVTLSAKKPTGTLTRNTSVCSLQPSPVNPHTGGFRDPKITPIGCDAILSWSNVKWSSPSIFYKTTGTNTWRHLYQIPCELNGETCSGSINTAEIIPELIPVDGVSFKLFQFNNASSGVLHSGFSITAHRFADIYEYDNGNLSEFNFANPDSLPTSLKIDNTLTTEAVIGVTQHNHNFHSPAAYDLREDIDSTQIPVINYDEGQVLSVTVSNMANGLDVGISLVCAGAGRSMTNEGEVEPFEGIYSFTDDPTSPVIVDPVTGNKTMQFEVTKRTTHIDDGILRSVRCLYNRIVLTRLSGTPSENLTYSVVVNDPLAAPTPIISSIVPTCKNKYCLNVLGENFDPNASVIIRENISGSSVTKEFKGHDIYSRSPINGQERLFVPTREPSWQNKFDNNGLCVKVKSLGVLSNEVCLTRPDPGPQSTFMDAEVESYHTLQDLEPNAFIAKNNNLLKIWGNSWKKIAKNYTVTPNTVLEFEFISNNQQPTINGVGFIMDGSTYMSPSRAWQVYGTKTNWGHQSHHNYTGNVWKTYRIPVGQTFTGQISDLVFIGDEDIHVGQNTVYKNVKLVESIPQPAFGFLYDPLKSGHGIHVSRNIHSTYLVYFYSYDQNGNPEWFMGTSNFVNNKLNGDLLKITHNSTTNSTSSSVVGSFTLDYSTSAVNNNNLCNGVNRDYHLGSFNWTINNQSGNWCMQPLFKNSADLTPSQPAANSGVWSQPSGGGWGISMQSHLSLGDYISYAVVYYYDANGVGRWSSGLDVTTDADSYSYEMKHYTGFPRTSTGSTVNQNNGYLNLNFGNSDATSVNVNYKVAPYGNWNRNNVPINLITR